MQADDFKSLIKEIGSLIDARAKTTETVMKAHISAEIHSAEERLRAEILAARAEAKADHLQLAGKVDKIAKDHTRRLETLEEKTETGRARQHLFYLAFRHAPAPWHHSSRHFVGNVRYVSLFVSFVKWAD